MQSSSNLAVTRRVLLQNTSAFVAAVAGQLPDDAPHGSRSDTSGALARYMANARDRKLPANVMREAKHRILDAIGAMISGSQLKAGEMAIRFVRTQGGTPEASVLGTNIKTSAINAALANGMFGHADETDDFEPITKAHPGCAVVPAALAMAERDRRSGAELISAVALGYDVCCRFLLALGPALLRATHRSAEGTSSTLGSTAAAASLARLDEAGMRYALSYAAQQVSGVWSWVRDSEHVEKAFDFGGMGARNGVTAAIFAQSGFTGVWDAFDGEHNVLDAFSTAPNPAELIADLGNRYFVTETAIKTFSVGYPIQAPLDALLKLQREHGLRPDNVERIIVKLPEDGARIVNNRSMPDVNCQYILAVALVDGALSFSASHSSERMADPQVIAVKNRIQLIADPALVNASAPRSGLVQVTLRDGRTVEHFTKHPPGTKENPLDTEGVNAKAKDLIKPVLGSDRTESIIRSVNSLEGVDDVRAIVALLV